MELNDKDLALIEEATKIVKANCDLYTNPGMHVGCAVRASSGKIYKGINIKTSHSICAEQIAVGQALASGERKIESIVSVKMGNDGSTRVVSPCGLCRYTFEKLELNCHVILEDVEKGTILKVHSDDLLPYPYKREANLKSNK